MRPIDGSEVGRHAAEIRARVRRTFPGDPIRQQRALSRWARVLSSNDPEVAAALMEATGRAA